MPSNRQKHLSFASKFTKFLRIKGKGLIHHHTLNDRFKKMTLHGTGTPAHKRLPEGGAIKHHNRPYQLKDSPEMKPKPARQFAPIHFKL